MFTIICPVYNAAKHLKNTVASVLSQQYKNWELILIDDGSTDDSAKLCDDFLTKDLRIKVIHKINEGPMMARKAGIKSASGTYIVFLDSDDELKPNALLELNEVIDDYDAVIYNATILSNNDSNKKTIARVKGTRSIKNGDVRNILFGEQIFGYLWLCCIKKDIIIKTLEENNRFESIRYTEDLYFLNLCSKHFENILLLDEDLYLYKINNESITKNLTHKDRRDRFLVFNEIFGQGGIKLSESVSNSIVWAALSYLQESITRSSKEESKKAFKEIRESSLFYLVIKNKKYVSSYLNLSVFLIKLNLYTLLKLFIKKQRRKESGF